MKISNFHLRCFGVLVFGLFFVGITSASEPSVCCENPTGGGNCLNVPASKCPDSSNSAETSCDSTSFCRSGTCYNSDEGICMRNTPRGICDDSEGTWFDAKLEDVPQCKLGCCIIADQAAFVPLVRCKKLSSDFGVENNYRTDIKSESECIAAAQSQDVGACVYEEEFERLCEFTTRGDCAATNNPKIGNGSNIIITGEKTFYKDYLCSNDELATTCAKQIDTTCYKGDVYWMDSCGNRENVYSDDKILSWNDGKILEDNKICEYNSKNPDIDCGNCDYLLGSRCSEHTGIGGPTHGDYYCRQTECTDRDGNSRINGESWCVYDIDTEHSSIDAVGDRHYREICSDGEVRVEPCADYRNEVCYSGKISLKNGGTFETAACHINRWQDCIFQTTHEDCNNTDKRDCKWMGPVTGMVINEAKKEGGGSNPKKFGNPTGSVIAPITGMSIFGAEEEIESGSDGNRGGGVCVPEFAPGLAFWEEGSAEAICSQASARCVVILKASLMQNLADSHGNVLENTVGALGASLNTISRGKTKGFEDFEDAINEGNWESARNICDNHLDGKNCDCLGSDWGNNANAVCTALGDCGVAINYNGVKTSDGYKYVIDGEDVSL